jgi:hypothetical protein
MRDNLAFCGIPMWDERAAGQTTMKWWRYFNSLVPHDWRHPPSPFLPLNRAMGALMGPGGNLCSGPGAGLSTGGPDGGLLPGLADAHRITRRPLLGHKADLAQGPPAVCNGGQSGSPRIAIISSDPGW